MTSNSLPFELSEDSISNWLQSLSQLNSVNSANQLNHVIKLLVSSKQDTNKTLNALILLTPVVLFVCSTIESSLLAVSNESTKSKKIERLCIQLLKNLSLCFVLFGEKNTLSAKQQNQAIYLALQLIGYSQRISLIFQHMPSTTLWKKMGELYLLVQRNNNSPVEIKYKTRFFKNQTTIESVLKRNLLFAILSSYQYPPDQNKELFSISEKYAHLLSFDIKKPSDISFAWGVSSGFPPSTQGGFQAINTFEIPINTNDFLFLIQSTGFSSSLDQETKEHIIARISRYKEIFDSTSSSIRTKNHIVTGFKAITHFLEKIGKLKKIQQFSLQYNNDSPIDNMSIELLESEKDYLSPTHNPTLNSNIDNFLTDIQAINTWATKNDQFVVAEISALDCSMNDIILLCGLTLKPELGIIRQIRSTNPPNGSHALIEKIAGLPTSHLIDSNTPVIIIQNQNVQSEIFIPPNKLQNDTQTLSFEDKTIELKKPIDYSSHFIRYHCLP